MEKVRLILISCNVLLLLIFCMADAQTYDGYTLYTSNSSNNIYLLDMDGEVAHSWYSANRGGYSAYLLESGHVLRSVQLQSAYLRGAAFSGKIEELDWDGNVVWDFTYNSTNYTSHHDIEPMPNGNVLLIAWELKSSTEATAAGRQNARTMWPDHIVEVEPDGNGGGNVVWEWHLWDHLIQDHDPNAENYGVIADHPELIDINLGSVGMGGPGGGGGDWMHMNGVDYNQELDQIAFSSHHFNEIYIIDHSTTAEEAAGHTGGNSGMGGDILYRWGNPANYGAEGDEYLDVCHCSVWVPDDCPGAGNLMVFNNGEGAHSSEIVEIETPINDDGTYSLSPGQAFEPETPTWTYSNGYSFYSNHLGSVQRLPNGNTLISESTEGYLFEVDTEGNILWDFDTNQEVPRVLRYGMDYPGLSALNPVNYDYLAINECLQINNSFIPDPEGEFEPWIELYNYGQTEIPLENCILGPVNSPQAGWTFPDTTLSPDHFLIIWLDGDLDQEGLHADFELSTSESTVFLLNPSGEVIDQVLLSDQTDNISLGRYPDGTGDFILMTPSFGEENLDGIEISVEEHELNPETFKLIGNYPNPFNPSTSINFSLDYAADVKINIYNTSGQLVRSLLSREFRSGTHRISWNGKDNTGNNLSSGTYFCVLTAANQKDVLKMLLLK